MVLSPKYKCVWYILDNSHRLLLGVCRFIFGSFNALLNLWLIISFIRSPLINSSRSHLPLLNLALVCFCRSILAGFPFSGSSALAGRWLYGEPCCQMFGFLSQMFGFLQIISVSLIALERYLVSRKTNIELSFRFYQLSVLLCWIIAAAIATPPLFNIGHYRCDVTGTTCEPDWRFINVDKIQIIYNATVIVGGAILPTFSIIWCLRKSNQDFFYNRETYAQIVLTKTVTIATSGMFLLWSPQALSVLWTAVGLGKPPRTFPVPLAIISPLSSEVAGMIPVLSYLVYNERIKAALLNTLDSRTGKSGKLLR